MIKRGNEGSEDPQMHPVCVLLQASNHTCVLCFTFFILYSFIHSFILHLFILNIYNLVIVLFN